MNPHIRSYVQKGFLVHYILPRAYLIVKPVPARAVFSFHAPDAEFPSDVLKARSGQEAQGVQEVDDESVVSMRHGDWATLLYICKGNNYHWVAIPPVPIDNSDFMRS